MTETERRAVEAVHKYDLMCDLDFRCPQAGRWPRTIDEAGEWAMFAGRDLVEWARTILPVASCSAGTMLLEEDG
jgi:hypothetical protein